MKLGSWWSFCTRKQNHGTHFAIGRGNYFRRHCCLQWPNDYQWNDYSACLQSTSNYCIKTITSVPLETINTRWWCMHTTLFWPVNIQYYKQTALTFQICLITMQIHSILLKTSRFYVAPNCLQFLIIRLPIKTVICKLFLSSLTKGIFPKNY